MHRECTNGGGGRDRDRGGRDRYGGGRDRYDDRDRYDRRRDDDRYGVDGCVYTRLINAHMPGIHTGIGDVARVLLLAAAARPAAPDVVAQGV